MSLVAFTLALTLSPSNGTSTVTLNEPPQTLASFLSKLGAQGKEQLSVSKDLEREVVQVSVKDVDYEVLMTKLASVSGGVWVQTNSGRRLDVDQQLARQEAQTELTQRTAMIKAEIDKLVSDSQNQPALDPQKMREEMDKARQEAEQRRQNAEAGQAAQTTQNGRTNPAGQAGQAAQNGRMNFPNMQNRMPGGRAIIQTLAAMRPEDLARIGVGQRVVFTTAPTPMQKPLPSTSFNVMRVFASEQSKWAANGGFGGRGAQRQQQAQGGQTSQRSTPQAQSPNPVQNLVPAKAFLIVNRFGQGLNIEYMVVDAQGRPIGNGNMTLGNRPPQQQNGAEAKSDQEAIALGSVAHEAFSVFGRNSGFAGMGMGQAPGFGMGGPGGFGGPGQGFGPGRGGGQGGPGRGPGGQDGRRGGGNNSAEPSPTPVPQEAGPQFGSGRAQVGQPFGGGQAPSPVSTELLALLKDPVSNDPLALTFGKVWSGVADASKSNLVALLPDSLLVSASNFFKSDRSPDQIKGASKVWNLKVEDQSGWLTVQPVSHLTARNERIDRAALKTLLASIEKKGGLRLDDVAAYATRSPYLTTSSFDIAVVRAVDPSVAQQVNQVYGQNRDMLLLFATLGTGARQSLGKGNTEKVSSLSPTANTIVGSMVYNSFDGPRMQQSIQLDVSGSGATQSGGVPVLSQVPVIGRLFTVELDPQQPGQQGRQNRQRNAGGRNFASQERTEILPTGLPGTSAVLVRTQEVSIAKATRKDAGLAQVMTPQMMAFESNPPPTNVNRNQNSRPTINWDGYVPGTRYQYTFEFTFIPGVVMQRTLTDDVFDANAKPVSANQLPEKFQSEMQAAKKMLDERRTQMEQRMQNGQQQQQQRGRGGRQNRQIPPSL